MWGAPEQSAAEGAAEAAQEQGAGARTARQPPRLFRAVCDKNATEVRRLLTERREECMRTIRWRGGRDLDGVTAVLFAAKYGMADILSMLCAALGGTDERQQEQQQQQQQQQQQKSERQLQGSERGSMAKAKRKRKGKDSSGLRLNRKTYSGYTALHFAAMFGHATVARVLLDARADVTARSTNGGCTALHLAAEGGHVQVMAVLLDHLYMEGELKRWINSTTDAGFSPIALAVARRHLEAAQLLTAWDVDVNAYTVTHVHAPISIVFRLLERFVAQAEALKAQQFEEEFGSDPNCPPFSSLAFGSMAQAVDADTEAKDAKVVAAAAAASAATARQAQEAADETDSDQEQEQEQEQKQAQQGTEPSLDSAKSQAYAHASLYRGATATANTGVTAGGDMDNDKGEDTDNKNRAGQDTDDDRNAGGADNDDDANVDGGGDGADDIVEAGRATPPAMVVAANETDEQEDDPYGYGRAIDLDAHETGEDHTYTQELVDTFGLDCAGPGDSATAGGLLGPQRADEWREYDSDEDGSFEIVEAEDATTALVDTSDPSWMTRTDEASQQRDSLHHLEQAITLCHSLIDTLVNAPGDGPFVDVLANTKTPLMISCELGEPDLVQLLLRKGADANMQCASLHGRTPVWFAIRAHRLLQTRARRIVYVQSIMQRNLAGDALLTTESPGTRETGADSPAGGDGADAMVADGDDGAPDIVPEDAGVVIVNDIIADLVKAGADPNVKYQDGHTPLRVAAETGVVSIVQTLLHQGADPAVVGVDGSTALHGATRSGLTESVSAAITELLLRAGADPNSAFTKGGETPLHHACLSGYARTVHFLLADGAIADAQATEGHTPLICALAMGHTSCVQALLEHGANTNLRTRANRLAPLHLCARDGLVDAAHLLIEAGAKMELYAGEWSGCTSLLMAAERGHRKIVELLLAAGMDFRQTLLYACRLGNVEVVRAILAGVDTCGNSQVQRLKLVMMGRTKAAIDDDDGRARHNFPMQPTDMTHGRHRRGEQGENDDIIDLTHPDEPDGDATACDDVEEKSDQELAYGADEEEDCFDSDCDEEEEDEGLWLEGSPLTIAASEGHYDVVDELLEHGFPVDGKGFNGYTAIVLAAASGHDAVVRLLVAHGASDMVEAREASARYNHDDLFAYLDVQVRQRGGDPSAEESNSICPVS